MEIKRDIHLKRLLDRRHNGMVKVVTGMRRSGKSYLLLKIFLNRLRDEGVDDDHIITVDLESRLNSSLRDPDALLKHILDRRKDDAWHYVVLDEVQLVSEFEDVLNTLLKLYNFDVYVTGSNARFLSSDVLTTFRGRGDEVRIRPLSFAEFYSARPDLSREAALQEYMIYGGMPQVVTMPTEEQKGDYLRSVFTHTFLKDILERHKITKQEEITELTEILASSIGSLTNPRNLSNAFATIKGSKLCPDTVKKFLDILEDAFLITKALRYDLKGKAYIDTPYKYYFEDLGLRNALLNFRQMDNSHLMENLIYNELRNRGMSVDVGNIVVIDTDVTGARVRKTLEVDFVCNQGYKRVYIQSALEMPTPEKVEQELRPLRLINDQFKKMLVTLTPTPTYQNDEGIWITHLFDFLTDPQSI